MFGHQELISLNLKGISSRHAECWSFVLCDSFVVVVSPRPLLVVPACCCCCQCWHLATVQRGYFHQQCGRVLSSEHIDLGYPEKVKSTSLKSKIDGSLLILFSNSEPPRFKLSLDSFPYLLTLHNQNIQINSLFPLCLELFKRLLLSRESNALSNPLFTPTAAKISGR